MTQTNSRYTLTPTEISMVHEWLSRNADRYHGQETGWDTAAMTDDCVYFLALPDLNNHIYELICAYTKNRQAPAKPGTGSYQVTQLAPNHWRVTSSYGEATVYERAGRARVRFGASRIDCRIVDASSVAAGLELALQELGDR